MRKIVRLPNRVKASNERCSSPVVDSGYNWGDIKRSKTPLIEIRGDEVCESFRLYATLLTKAIQIDFGPEVGRAMKGQIRKRDVEDFLKKRNKLGLKPAG